ncbi:DeoR/GlpR family DNA-binding transcription regulator [Scandinavium manionii]|uniref:DeoR/GlpR family DNA-binding transcription regulator n=1 Tax=Scandinavium manionii TaxID=2926520 RepID=UPI00135803CF|nr:DeoR/GlpR family DNA-binding transcription regulator [Scandinavium manionii]MCS2149975.1 DeoR/GlpR family DNA-binding transcription regulator [Scandinavium manionii]MCS2168337.1 DeoR/GlpR family DNA-binding transcription regulator [Scandinavium manionii]
MLPLERQEKILGIIKDKGVVSVGELVNALGVSHMTIRRDIQRLEQLNALASVSGGVALPQRTRLLNEPSHRDKTLMFPQEKEAISLAAMHHIPRNSTVYLDAGTTTLALARKLVNHKDLLIVTNDFAIANLMIEQGQGELIHTGGRLCRENQSTVGHLTAVMLENLFIDVAFISASSWNLRGLSTPNENKAIVKQAVARVSEKCILLSDSSKYGKMANFRVMPLTELDLIISDEGLSDSVEQLTSQKIAVELAPPV